MTYAASYRVPEIFIVPARLCLGSDSSEFLCNKDDSTFSLVDSERTYCSWRTLQPTLLDRKFAVLTGDLDNQQVINEMYYSTWCRCIII